MNTKNHWKEKWISWWTEYPKGNFPRNTHACKTLSDIRIGEASSGCYEGMILASCEIEKIKSKEDADKQ